MQKLIQPEAGCLMIDGTLQLDMLKKKRLSQETLFSQLRICGIDNLGQIRRCYLEHNGELSVFKFDKKNRFDGLSILPLIDKEQ